MNTEKEMAINRAAALGTGLAVATAIALASTGAFAAGFAKELKAAETHAGYAARSTTLKMVHAHLHDVVNCLVGPDGAGFDTMVRNPCRGMGKGGIPEVKAAKHMKTLKTLKRALKDAERGLQARSRLVAQGNALRASELLRAAEEQESAPPDRQGRSGAHSDSV